MRWPRVTMRRVWPPTLHVHTRPRRGEIRAHSISSHLDLQTLSGFIIEIRPGGGEVARSQVKSSIGQLIDVRHPALVPKYMARRRSRLVVNLRRPIASQR